MLSVARPRATHAHMGVRTPLNGTSLFTVPQYRCEGLQIYYAGEIRYVLVLSGVLFRLANEESRRWKIR